MGVVEEKDLVLFTEGDIEEYKKSFPESVKTLITRIQEIGEVQLEAAVDHFAPHVYMRELFIPAGQIAVGKTHKTEHFNIVLKGHVSVASNDFVMTVEAPHIFVSKANTRKVALAHTDTIWLTVHPTDETDTEKLENELVEPENLI